MLFIGLTAVSCAKQDVVPVRHKDTNATPTWRPADVVGVFLLDHENGQGVTIVDPSPAVLFVKLPTCNIPFPATVKISAVSPLFLIRNAISVEAAPPAIICNLLFGYEVPIPTLPP